MTKKQLLKKLNQLETKADVYCRRDWDAYQRTLEEIRRLDMILLDMYTKEGTESKAMDLE